LFALINIVRLYRRKEWNEGKADRVGEMHTAVLAVRATSLTCLVREVSDAIRCVSSMGEYAEGDEAAGRCWPRWRRVRMNEEDWRR
jgi:hypothetical protein